MEDSLSLASTLNVVGESVMNESLSVGKSVIVGVDIKPSLTETADLGFCWK